MCKNEKTLKPEKNFVELDVSHLDHGIYFMNVTINSNMYVFKISKHVRVLPNRINFTKQKKQDLDHGLEKTKKSFFSKIASTVAGKSKVDEEVLDDLEEVLVSSDVSVKTTLKIIKRLEERVKNEKYVGINQLSNLLKEEISEIDSRVSMVSSR